MLLNAIPRLKSSGDDVEVVHRLETKEDEMKKQSNEFAKRKKINVGGVDLTHRSRVRWVVVHYYWNSPFRSLNL